VAKPGLDDWKAKMGQYHKIYSSALAFRGTVVHHFCEKLVYGNEVTLDDITAYILWSGEERWKMEFTLDNLNYSCRQMIRGFVKFWNEKEPKAIAVEYPLYHPSVPYAGRADMVLEMVDKKGVTIRVLMDIKTGSENPHFTLQNSAYKNIWDTIYPNEPITHVGNLYLNDRFRTEKGVYRVKITKPNLSAFEDAHKVWNWANTKASQTKPVPRLKDPPPTEFKLNIKKETPNGVSKKRAKAA
jgi:hypothetical protein|tara:strand:+ start:712 stop:1437 length:726 start_codon:yes stop_codon:yes gene_type:complete